MHGCKILSFFKIHGLKFILKFKIQIKNLWSIVVCDE